jgi:hypothetical protein
LDEKQRTIFKESIRKNTNYTNIIFFTNNILNTNKNCQDFLEKLCTLGWDVLTKATNGKKDETIFIFNKIKEKEEEEEKKEEKEEEEGEEEKKKKEADQEKEEAWGVEKEEVQSAEKEESGETNKPSLSSSLSSSASLPSSSSSSSPYIIIRCYHFTYYGTSSAKIYKFDKIQNDGLSKTTIEENEKIEYEQSIHRERALIVTKKKTSLNEKDGYANNINLLSDFDILVYINDDKIDHICYIKNNTFLTLD